MENHIGAFAVAAFASDANALEPSERGLIVIERCGVTTAGGEPVPVDGFASAPGRRHAGRDRLAVDDRRAVFRMVAQGFDKVRVEF